MEINLTAIERNLRYYGPPAGLVLASLTVAMFTTASGSTAGLASILGPIKEVVHLGALAIALNGLIWLGYRAWIEWRLVRGDFEGGCIRCGGPMRHLDGLNGNYSKCLMCGAKREGWH